MESRERTAPPGLLGDYQDSCVGCRRGTDTGLGFRGPAEWAVAGLINCGVPQDEAEDILATAWGTEPGTVPDGVVEIAVRCCQDCAPMPVGLAATGVPMYAPPA